MSRLELLNISLYGIFFFIGENDVLSSSYGFIPILGPPSLTRSSNSK